MYCVRLPRELSQTNVSYLFGLAVLLKFGSIMLFRYETSAHLWLVLEYCVGGDLLSILRQVHSVALLVGFEPVFTVASFTKSAL